MRSRYFNRWIFQRQFENHRDNSDTREQDAFNSAADLGPPNSPPTIYRRLDHVQAALYCLDLHFNGPAKTTILYLEFLQGAESGCPEWARLLTGTCRINRINKLAMRFPTAPSARATSAVLSAEALSQTRIRSNRVFTSVLVQYYFVDEKSELTFP